MSEKMGCVGCGSYTSGVLAAYEEGEDCPYCHLPHEAAASVLMVRDKKANAEVTALYEEAIVRATRAEAEVAKWRRYVTGIREVRIERDESEGVQE